MLLKILPAALRQYVINNEKLVDVDSVISWIKQTTVLTRAEGLRERQDNLVSAIHGALAPGEGCDVPITEAPQTAVNQALVDAANRFPVTVPIFHAFQ